MKGILPKLIRNSEIIGFRHKYLVKKPAIFQIKPVSFLKLIFAAILGLTISFMGGVFVAPSIGKSMLMDTAQSDLSSQGWANPELVYTLKGHKGTIETLAFSPDGELLISGGGSMDGKIRVWNLKEGGDNIRTVKAHTNRVLTVAFAGDNETFASGSDDGMLNIWNRYKDEPNRIFLKPATNVMSLAISPNVQTLVSGGLDGVKFWDLRTRRPLRELLPYETIYSVNVSYDGRFLASGDKDGNIKIWDFYTADLVKTIKAHNGAVNVVVFSSDGEKLITGGYDSFIKVWDVKTGDLLNTLVGHVSQVNSLAINPDGVSLASAGFDGIRIWNLNSGELVGKFLGHSDWVQSLAFSPDGELLASGGFDRLVKVWKAGPVFEKPVISNSNFLNRR